MEMISAFPTSFEFAVMTSLFTSEVELDENDAIM